MFEIQWIPRIVRLIKFHFIVLKLDCAPSINDIECEWISRPNLASQLARLFTVYSHLRRSVKGSWAEVANALLTSLSTARNCVYSRLICMLVLNSFGLLFLPKEGKRKKSNWRKVLLLLSRLFSYTREVTEPIKVYWIHPFSSSHPIPFPWVLKHFSAHMV